MKNPPLWVVMDGHPTAATAAQIRAIADWLVPDEPGYLHPVPADAPAQRNLGAWIARQKIRATLLTEANRASGRVMTHHPIHRISLDDT